ncbi:MAG: alpha/beta fold hydrolase [Lautropia sp.]
MPTADLPEPVRSLADLASIEAAARRVETPCGDASVVWHLWGEGDPVVLLHGGSGSWTHWVRNVGALVRAGRTVCVPDLPGCGDSARPPVGEDADALPEWIEAGTDALLGDAAFDLVGFSFGSMVACFMAQRRPARVRRLVLSGAPALSTEPINPLRLRPWSHLTDPDARMRVHRYNIAQLMLARPASIDDLALAIHAANVVRDRLRRRRISKTDILMRTLPRVTCPVFGIWGAEDVLYQGRQHLIEPGLALAPGFGSLTMIAGAGHWVQYEASDAFNRVLLDLLR